jgi:hypothetical protein
LSQKLAAIEEENNHRFQMFIRVLLALTFHDRLTILFREEVNAIRSGDVNPEDGSLYEELIKVIMDVDTEFILRYCGHTTNIFRDFSRCNTVKLVNFPLFYENSRRPRFFTKIFFKQTNLKISGVRNFYFYLFPYVKIRKIDKRVKRGDQKSSKTLLFEELYVNFDLSHRHAQSWLFLICGGYIFL